MSNKLINFNSHYIGKITNIQDSIILCDVIFSNPFIGEIVYFQNNTSFKGIIFEISLKNIKILLLDCDQKTLFIGNSIFGLRETSNSLLQINSQNHSNTNYLKNQKRNYSTHENKDKNKFQNKSIDIHILSDEEFKIKESETYKKLELISDPEIIKLVENMEKMESYNENYDDSKETFKFKDLFYTSRIVQFILFFFYIFFHLILVFFCFLALNSFYFIRDKLLFYMFGRFIYYINTKWKKTSTNFSYELFELLDLNNLTLIKKIIINLWILTIIPLLIFFILLVNFITLICSVICFIFSILVLPSKYITGWSVPINKYINKMLVVLFFFSTFSLVYCILSFFLPNLYWFKWIIFFLIFVYFTFLNYKKKKKKVVFSFFNIFIYIHDLLIHRLDSSYNNFEEVLTDLYDIRRSGESTYNISLFFSIFKDFFTKLFYGTNNLNDNNENWTYTPPSSINVSAITNSKKNNNNKKRFYGKEQKIIQTTAKLGNKIETFSQSINQFKTNNLNDRIKHILHSSKIKGLPIQDVSYIDFETNSKVITIEEAYINRSNKKIYLVTKLNNGQSENFSSEFNIDHFDKKGFSFFFKEQQMFKLKLDLVNLKLSEYKIFKGIYNFVDITNGYWDDKPFFSNAFDIFDKKMNNHNFFSFPYTAIDQVTNEIVLRYANFIATSSSTPSKEGNVFNKSFEHSKDIHYDKKKSFSVIVDKLRCLSNTDMKQVNYINKEYEFTSCNKKHAHVVGKFLYDKIVKEKVLIFSDAVTGKKYTFLTTGNKVDYFVNNPHMVKKYITTNTEYFLNQKLGYLNWYATNEDYIFSLYYKFLNHGDNYDYIETSPKDLISLD